MTFLVTGESVNQATNEIKSSYGDEVSVTSKAKSLLKFGRNAGLGISPDTVWEQGGNEVYVTDNLITHVSSSSASDTAVIIRIEGHTISGAGENSQFAFSVQSVALNGQSKVALATPIARVSRAFSASGNLAGDFYVYEDDTVSAGVPDTASKIHISVLGASESHTQSFKAATTFSNTDYFLLTGFYASVTKKTSASVDFVIEGRTPGGVFRPLAGRLALQSSALTAIQIRFAPYIIVPKNSDIRVRASSSSTNTEVDASFQGYLAGVIS